MGGVIFMVAFVGLLAWGCLAIIAGAYGLALPLFHPVIAAVIGFAGPPLLITSAGFSWLRARAWRGMTKLKVTPPGGEGTRLARGDYAIQLTEGGPSALERLTLALAILGLTAVPYWIGLPGPKWWIGGGLIVWVFRRALF